MSIRSFSHHQLCVNVLAVSMNINLDGLSNQHTVAAPFVR